MLQTQHTARFASSFKQSAIALTMMLLVEFCGCESNGPDIARPDAQELDTSDDARSPVASGTGPVFYSGEFAVVNESDKSIRVNNWENFGEAMPATGNVEYDTEAYMIFPTLSRIPASTVVSWVFRDDPDETVHTQTIDLQRIVPANTEGQTEFIFDEDGQWTVRFVPADGSPIIYPPPAQSSDSSEAQNSSDTAPFYSGAFAVTNASDRKIVIQDWESSDGTHPATGGFPPQFQIAGTHESQMDQFPESTVVTWMFEDDPDATVHSQTIDLIDIVPPNNEGRTEFIFGADGQWTVRFLPEPE